MSIPRRSSPRTTSKSQPQPQTTTQPEHQPQTTSKSQPQPQTTTQPQPQHQTLAPLPSWSLCLKGTPSVRNAEAALLLFCHSGSSSSKIAIDNKIEQAMDLVKSHLMLAVREEEELLRKRINQLSERNAQLERENYILRALRDRQRH
ncbi:TSC22 domain family protein 1-like [Oncorhynchus clarkii lewisi]|uniref:TSC22 domain family protein 1-like n=1 Tax=Oncorhynchus clarkii lewisi TaxID=490388 RepID=UPI0039B92145